MSPDIINNTQRYQYTAHNGDDLLSQVDKVICLISQNSLITAGFHPSGAVLTVHCSHLAQAAWHTKLIEHELLNDPLLAAPELIKQVFIASNKQIVIPNNLLENQQMATEWLQRIYFCEASEHIAITNCAKSAETIAYAYPKDIALLCTQYFAPIKSLPISLIQLQYGATAESLLQCTLIDNSACACIHLGKKLQWQQSFDFESAEDIVYQLAAACEQLNIDIHKLPLHITATSPTQIIKDLAHYLPNMSEQQANMASRAATEWASTILLFQQLNTCE
jgi:hypothetical protein